MHPAAGELEEEEDVEAPQPDCLDTEEVTGQDNRAPGPEGSWTSSAHRGVVPG
jgi:hypothetical protein